jgi:hypothetical protein
MKNFAAILLIGVVALALPRPSRAAGGGGYFDPATGRFVPMVSPKVAPKDPPVTRTGTVDLDITLTIESAIGSDESVTCDATLSSDDASFFNEVTASGTVSGRPTGTLTLTMPYDWTQAATGESATVSLSCAEQDFEGTVDHSMEFLAPVTFTVPTTAGTVTKETFTGSL